MPGGRQTTPLFDLLRRQNGAASAQAPGTPTDAPRPPKPMVRVELKPQVEPSLSPSRETAPDAPLSVLRLPLNAFWYAVALFVALLFLVFFGGYKLGKDAANRQADRELGERLLDRPGINDPLNQPSTSPAPQPSSSSSSTPTSPSTRTPAPNTQTQSDSDAISPGVGAVLSSRGVTADPREHGQNYLALATLSKTDAEAAIAFMSQNGVEIIGVPVDRGGGRANNAGPAYRLFAATGITSEQYRTKQTARTNLEAEVARLGDIWQKQHHGASNFAKPGWEKF